MEKEVRTYKSEFTVEKRSVVEDDNLREINVAVGYALEFNKFSRPFGDVYERIDSRALDNADMSRVMGLFNHDESLLLGTNWGGTLKLSVDERGLKYEVELPPTDVGNRVKYHIDKGDITESSFGFAIDWADAEAVVRSKENGKKVRTLKKIAAIYDVSPVTMARYANTSVGLKRMANEFDELEKETENTAYEPNDSGNDEAKINEQKRSIDLDWFELEIGII